MLHVSGPTPSARPSYYPTSSASRLSDIGTLDGRCDVIYTTATLGEKEKEWVREIA
jgi:hypothetical protein